MTNPGGLLQNNLLDALPAHNYSFLSSLLKIIQLSSEEVLYKSGEALRYADLPTTCIVSMNFMAEQGASTKVAIIGNEGMIGIILFMNSKAAPSRANWRASKRSAPTCVALLSPGMEVIR